MPNSITRGSLFSAPVPDAEPDSTTKTASQRGRAKSIAPIIGGALRDLPVQRRAKSAPPSLGQRVGLEPPVSNSLVHSVGGNKNATTFAQDVRMQESVHTTEQEVPIETQANAGAASVRSSDQPSTREAQLNRGVKYLRLMDASSLLAFKKTHNDAEFIEEIRDGSSQTVNIPQALRNLDLIKTRIGEAGLPDQLTHEFKTRIDAIRQSLLELNTDKSLLKRVGMVLGPNMIMAGIPFIVPLLGQPRQQQFAAELFALLTKTALEGVGMIRTPSTGVGLVKDRLMARNYANLVQAFEFMLPTFVKPSRKLGQNIGVDLAAAAVSTILLFAGFLGGDIRKKFNRAVYGSPAPTLKAAGERLSLEARTALDDIHKMVSSETAALRNKRDAFLDGDAKALSPHVNKQVQLALGLYSQAAEKIAHTLNVGEGRSDDNPDRNAKIALAVFTGLITGATAALIFPDTIGVVDLGSDAAFTTALMSSFVGDPNMSRKDALDEFKTFAGLSVVLLGVLVANKIAHDFIENGLTGLLIGSLTLSALNATMPGLVGHASAKGLEAAMNKLSMTNTKQWMDIARGVGEYLHSAFQARSRQAELQTASIEDMSAEDIELGNSAAA